MYNIFQASKIKKQLRKQRLKRQKQQQWLNKYNDEVQPKLLDSYNKRINTFMRKMEEHPIVLKKFDPSQSIPQKLFRNTDKETFLGNEYFRFKDHNDWNSIYTQGQRLERKDNEKYMLEKFGDSSLAYRSLVSQSDYVSSCKHQFRIRTKQFQINPPMKYACQIPKLMVKKRTLQAKRQLGKLKTEGSETNKKQDKQQRDHRDRNLSIANKHLSVHMDDDNKSIRSFRSIGSFAESVANTVRTKHTMPTSEEQLNQQENEQTRKKQQNKFLSPKMHFKTLIQAFQTSKDEKVKKNIRQILVKCGVFRTKQRRINTEGDNDSLSFELQTNVNQNSASVQGANK